MAEEQTAAAAETPRDTLVEQVYTPGRVTLPVSGRVVELRQASFNELPITARIQKAHQQRADRQALITASLAETTGAAPAAPKGKAKTKPRELTEEALRDIIGAAIDNHIGLVGLVPEIFDDAVALASRLTTPSIPEAEIRAMHPRDGAALCDAAMGYGLDFEAVNIFLGRPTPATA